MKRILFPSLLLLFLATVSGCIFDSNDDKETEKGTVKGKVSMIITGEPLANVKVMLVNTDVKADTVHYENNRRAFIDSAFTNADGGYAIDNVPPGNYGVVPLWEDSTAAYTFSPAQDSEFHKFSMDGETVTANFMAEKLSVPGADDQIFEISITLKNRKNDDFDTAFLHRRQWNLFFPTWNSIGFYKIVNNQIHIIYNYGYTAVIVTVDNYFLVQGSSFEFEVGFSCLNTPAYSEFEYDCAAKTLTQIK